MSLDYTFYAIDLNAYRAEVEPVFDRHHHSGSLTEVIPLIEKAIGRFRANVENWQTEYSEPDFDDVLEFFLDRGRSVVRSWLGVSVADLEEAMPAKAQALVLESFVLVRGADGALLQFEFGRSHLAGQLMATSVWVVERFQSGVPLSGGPLRFFGGTEAELFSEADLNQFRIEVQTVPTEGVRLHQQRSALLDFIKAAPEGRSKHIVRTMD